MTVEYHVTTSVIAGSHKRPFSVAKLILSNGKVLSAKNVKTLKTLNEAEEYANKLNTALKERSK